MRLSYTFVTQLDFLFTVYILSWNSQFPKWCVCVCARARACTHMCAHIKVPFLGCIISITHLFFIIYLFPIYSLFTVLLFHTLKNKLN